MSNSYKTSPLNTLEARKNLFRWARYRAAKHGTPFDISVDDIEIPECCPVFGFPLEMSHGSPGFSSPSLDRVDIALGYIKSNIRVISLRANRLKGDATLTEVKRIAEYMVSSGAS